MAISASRLALNGECKSFRAMEKVTKTMRRTRRVMNDKYTETAKARLEVNVIEVPVNLSNFKNQ